MFASPATALQIIFVLLLVSGLAALIQPFLFVGASSIAGLGLMYAWYRHARQNARPMAASLPPARLRVVTLVFAIVVAVAVVQDTGGRHSPLEGIVFLPIMLAALFFGLAGSAPTGLLIAALSLVDGSRNPAGGSGADLPADALVQAAVYVLVAALSGAMAQSLFQAASEARAQAAAQEERARAEAERAAEAEWFADTSVMMQSLYDREHMLSVALLRLADLIPAEVMAVFLREPEGADLQLSLLTGMPGEAVSLRHLSRREQETHWRGQFTARLWPDVAANCEGLGALAALDPAARSVIVAPLSTLDDFFGLLYVAARAPGTLTERHRLLAHQFAQHIVFPLQRIRLQALATTDVMTGLSNHRAFRQRLREELERARRYGSPVSLIMLDIDYFKRANDTYGHQAGDALLGQLAAILRRSLRGIDMAARYGGEEMAIICPETRNEEAQGLAERIRATVANHAFTLPDEGEARMTISLGVATAPVHATEEAALIEAADRALFAAKAAGRNRVCAYEGA